MAGAATPWPTTSPRSHRGQHRKPRVRAAADWIEGAVATGQVTPEEGLARLLAGE
ncbi:DUF6192 family protein [Actinoplanes sp. CA-030573]|uniref:DUF6192 family protein n=1 Tax=Actinoplanes sp. CA-030573 TaxID=3239898 RepID=UPI003D8A16BB